MSRKPRASQSEVLHNYVNDSVKNTFLPLNLTQSVFLISLYTIRDRFITYKSFTSTCLSFINVLLIISTYSYRIGIADSKYIFMYINAVVDLVFYSCGSILNFCTSIIYKDLNIYFVLKIQELSQSDILTSNSLWALAMHNWICMFLYLSFYVIVDLILVSLFRFNVIFTLSEVICQTVLFGFDINLIYATQATKILRTALLRWISDVKSYKQNSLALKENAKSTNTMTSFLNVWDTAESRIKSHSKGNSKESLSGSVDDKHEYQHNIREFTTAPGLDRVKEEFWKLKLKDFVTILEASEMIKSAFQELILYHSTETFLHAVVYVYYAIEYIQAFKYDSSETILGATLIFLWTSKNILIVSLLSAGFEAFYVSVNDARVNSLMQLTQVLNCEQEAHMHKNVVRLAQQCCKFDVCNLFSMDATTPRRLLSLIATYTLVLLQFVLL